MRLIAHLRRLLLLCYFWRVLPNQFNIYYYPPSRISEEMKLSYCFLVEDDHFIVLLREESGYQKLTSNFSKEFVREDKNVICYSNPWRTKWKLLLFYYKRSWTQTYIRVSSLPYLAWLGIWGLRNSPLVLHCLSFWQA